MSNRISYSEAALWLILFSIILIFLSSYTIAHHDALMWMYLDSKEIADNFLKVLGGGR